jgi:hypothetical protein
MLYHDNAPRPDEQPEDRASRARSVALSECILRRIEVFIPDSDYDSLEDKGAALSRLLKAFGFTFQTPSARQEVSETLVTALISETRLSENELIQIQESLAPLTDEPPNDPQYGQEPLYGISITCIGQVEAPADPSATLTPRSIQGIRLKHVEVEEYDDDAWYETSDYQGDNEEPDDLGLYISEIENPVMSLIYLPDSQRPGVSCSIAFNPELECGEDEVSWSCARNFVSTAGLPQIPTTLDRSWTIQPDPIGSYIIATNGLYAIEIEVPDNAPPAETCSAPLSELRTPSVAWSELRIAKAGGVTLIDPPDPVLAKICESIGVPEVAGLIQKTRICGDSYDNPTTATASIISRLGGGEVQVHDEHRLNSQVLETRSSASIELDNTAVGAVLVDVVFGRSFRFAVYPPVPSAGDQEENLAHQREQIVRASRIPWDTIHALARTFSGS